MDELETELKQLIIDSLCLEDLSADKISSDEPLFGSEGLALDSIDALEIGVEIQKRYGVKINPEDENVRSYFANVRALAKFVVGMR
jgi:acyl carrier protein